MSLHEVDDSAYISMNINRDLMQLCARRGGGVVVAPSGSPRSRSLDRSRSGIQILPRELLFVEKRDQLPLKTEEVRPGA